MIWPRRSMGISPACGSLTLMIMSARPIQLAGAVDQFGPLLGVVLVGDAGAQPGPGLDQDVVSGAGELLRAHRQQSDAILVPLGFFGYADDHGIPPSPRVTNQIAIVVGR